MRVGSLVEARNEGDDCSRFAGARQACLEVSSGACLNAKHGENEENKTESNTHEQMKVKENRFIVELELLHVGISGLGFRI